MKAVTIKPFHRSGACHVIEDGEKVLGTIHVTPSMSQPGYVSFVFPKVGLIRVPADWIKTVAMLGPEPEKYEAELREQWERVMFS